MLRYLIYLFIFGSTISFAKKAKIILDYETLTQKMDLTNFRAGHHDPSGINRYYFKVSMIGLIFTEDERHKPLEERRHIVRETGEFARLELPSLAFWELTNPPPSLTINGSEIRTLVSDMMNEFKVVEEQVAIQTKIELFVERKKYFILPDDFKIGETDYFTLPYERKVLKTRTNQVLDFKDEMGMHAKVLLKFYEVLFRTENLQP